MDEIDLPRPVQKTIDKLYRANPEDAKNIVRRLLALMENPMPPSARLVRGKQDYYRVRVGAYRIVYAVCGGTLHIHAIGKRNDGEVYKKLERRGG